MEGIEARLAEWARLPVIYGEDMQVRAAVCAQLLSSWCTCMRDASAVHSNIAVRVHAAAAERQPLAAIAPRNPRVLCTAPYRRRCCGTVRGSTTRRTWTC
jgi:hypothetical protein